jgi:hypothetical protein
MRFFDTRRFIDPARAPLMELYELRAGKKLEDLEQEDLDRPEVMRTILEVRAWHLPPLFLIPPHIRSTVRAIREEELLTNWQLPASRLPQCPVCSKRRPIYGILRPACFPCWDLRLRESWQKVTTGSTYERAVQVVNNMEEQCLDSSSNELRMVGSPVELITWMHANLRMEPWADGQPTQVWSSPKRAFLAMEAGCANCGRRHPKTINDWVWSMDPDGWDNGLCDVCVGSREFPSHYMWGMHPADYIDWQKSFAESRKLHRTAQRHGPLSLLLVSDDYEWVRFLSKSLPAVPIQLSDPDTQRLSQRPLGSVLRRGLSLEDFK